jgi:pilus assembly protein CpaE
MAKLIASALGTGTRTLPHLDAARDALNSSTDQDVVVVGPSVDATATFRFASDYRVTRPTLGVVLVRRRVDTALLSEALRNGVRDIVEERDLAGINTAVTRAADLAAELRLVGEGGDSASADSHRGQIITVFSAKGGCGKTTVSTNLGAMLASEFGKSVCVVDLDLEFGDVAIALQLVPAHSIHDTVEMGPRLDADGLEALLTPHQSGLKALTAPIGPDSHESIKPELVERILDVLVHTYEYVIVDTPPSFDPTVLATFDRTDLLVLLTTMDVPAIKNLKIAIETLAMLNFPTEKQRVIVNRSDSRVGININDVEKSIRTPVSARIPSSRDVPATTNRGVPLTTDNPKHPVSQAMRSFVHEHLGLTSEFDDASGRRGRLRSRKA